MNLTGTITGGLTLDTTTGSWTLSGGTVQGGSYRASGEARLVFTTSGGTLDGLTAERDLDLATTSGYATVTNGLTLAPGTMVLLGNAAGTTYGSLNFSGNQTLGGSGTVLFGKSTSNALSPSTGTTLTVGAGITVRGSNGTIGSSYYSSTALINQGTILADDSGGMIGNFTADGGFSGGVSYAGSTYNVIDTSGVADPAPGASTRLTATAGTSSTRWAG